MFARSFRVALAAILPCSRLAPRLSRGQVNIYAQVPAAGAGASPAGLQTLAASILQLFFRGSGELIHAIVQLVILWAVLRALIWLFIAAGEVTFNATNSDEIGILVGLLIVAGGGACICGLGFSAGLLASGIAAVVIMACFGLLTIPGAVLIAAGFGLAAWLVLAFWLR